eukprot:gene9958-2277_t
MQKEVVDDFLTNPVKDNLIMESPRDIVTDINRNRNLTFHSVSVRQPKKKFKPIDATDMTKILPQDFYGLSQPIFNTNGTKFVCGTENQKEENNNLNRIVFGSLNHQNVTKLNSKIWSYPINEHIRSCDWIDENRILLALNSKLGLLELDESGSASEILLFPELHSDTIRQLSYSQKNKMMISGGFDGNVYVTNVLRLLEDMQKNEKKTENSVYVCKDVVGSVCWHPKDEFFASCTTDTGRLHLFDIRVNDDKPAYVFDSFKSELYTHTYMNDETIILGFGDGSIQIHETRMGSNLLSFQDPYQKYIGDLSYEHDTCAVFGSEVSFWKYTGNDIEILAHHTNSKAKGHKTSGCFIPKTELIASTDSIGIFSIYDCNKVNV